MKVEINVKAKRFIITDIDGELDDYVTMGYGNIFKGYMRHCVAAFIDSFSHDGEHIVLHKNSEDLSLLLEALEEKRRLEIEIDKDF